MKRNILKEDIILEDIFSEEEIEEKLTPRVLRSDKELKIEKEELEIRLEQVENEKKRIEELIKLNELDRKRLNSFKRRTYFFAFISCVISMFILYLLLNTQSFYNYAIFIFPIVFAYISFSYNFKNRLIALVCVIVGFGIYNYFSFNKYIENVSLVYRLVDKLNIEVTNNLYKIVTSSIVMGVVLGIFFYILQMGDIIIGDKINILKFLLKNLILLVLGLIVITVLSIGLFYLINYIIEKNEMNFFYMQIRITSTIVSSVLMFTIYFLNLNTLYFRSRKNLKGRA